MMYRVSRNRQGFTLIELLVVIAIIAILAAILFPVFARAREKARQITCISNEKQLGLAFLQYFQDYDDHAPFFGEVDNGGDWWTSRMRNWKDGIFPYVKSGGLPYNNGQPYANHGSGGAFACPDNTALWSNESPHWWGINDAAYATAGAGGDETTRYPRSYAVNGWAGIDDTGDGNNGGHFWPCVGDGSCDKNPGSVAILGTPADTIMVAETRVMFPDITASYTGFGCSSGGTPEGGHPTSCIQGHTGGFTNFLFFDGHAKTLHATTAIEKDYWGAYKVFGAASQANDLASANGVGEWNPGF